MLLEESWGATGAYAKRLERLQADGRARIRAARAGEAPEP